MTPVIDQDIFEKCEKHAKENYDGHYTLLRFSSDWAFCFGTLMDVNPYTTALMSHGSTPSEAMLKGLPPEPAEKTEPITVNKVSRNAPCPCGSGQKYKKCCI